MDQILEALYSNAVLIIGSIGTAIVGLVAVYARELALRSAARQAALKAEVESMNSPATSSGPDKLAKALDAFKAETSSPLLTTSDERKKQLIEAQAKGTGEWLKSLGPTGKPPESD